jgi:hypothetical protein
MFRHVVLFKWKPGTSVDTVAAVAAGLSACAAALPVARSYTCGPDVQAAGSQAGSEERYDFGVVADFDDEAGWRVYDKDPEHNRLRAELIRPLIAERATIQFEV